MTDADITAKITSLEDEQHKLRAVDTEGAARSDADLARLSEIGVELDQLWDQLRRRRAKEEFGQDASGEGERPASQVEGYQG